MTTISVSPPGEATYPSSRLPAARRLPPWSAWLTRGQAADLLALVAIVVLAAVVRSIRLGFQSFWLDEAHTVFYATNQSLALFWQHLLKPGENGPLYYFVLAPWLHLFGGSEVSARAFSVLAGLPAVPLCFVALRRLAGARVALLATALFAFAPYETWYAQEAKMYTLLVTLSAAALVCFLYACDRRHVGLWLLYVVVAFSAIFTHFFAAFAVLSHGALGLWLFRRDRYRRVPLLVTGAMLGGIFVLESLAISRDVVGTAQFGGPSLIEQVGTLIYAFTLNVAPAPLPLVLFVVIALVFVGSSIGWLLPPLRQRLHRGRRRPSSPLSASQPSEARERATLPIAPVPSSTGARASGIGLQSVAILFWVPLAGFVAMRLVFNASVFADRYFIFLTPAFYALLAGALLWLLERGRLLGLVAVAAVGAAWVYGTVYELAVPVKEDFRTAVAEYNTEARSGDAVIPVPASLAFPIGYYAKTFPTFSYVDLKPDGEIGGGTPGAGSAGAAGNGTSAPDFAQLLAGKRRVWVMGVAPDEYPPLHDLRAWLAEHGHVVRREQLAGRVRVWLYTLDT